MNIAIPRELETLLRTLPELRQAYLVGGCVRDALLGHPGKDYDIEVFGVSYDQLEKKLRKHGRVEIVGRSFGVAKLSLGDAVHDFSLPRWDSKTGPGHRGFEVRIDPGITPRDAAARRDYTINSLMFSPHRHELLDFFGGAKDLEARILRHTSPAFSEDPLRVLRGMQFAGRFELTPARETVELCRPIIPSYRELAIERVREEWFKWAALSVRPSAGIRFLEASGWMVHFPELDALRGIPQDPAWHPEGDVYIHTCHALDALVELPAWKEADEATRIVETFAVLTHDFGKATSTQTVERDGQARIISPGHEHESARLAAGFLNRIQAPRAILDRVVPLAANHMAHFHDVTDRAIRRLARRLQPETVAHLCTVMTADAFARPPLERAVPQGLVELQRTAELLELKDAAPHPILLGRHFIALGFHPGREVGRWVEAAFEAQLDGQFQDLDGAWKWLAEQAGLDGSHRERARLRIGEHAS